MSQKISLIEAAEKGDFETMAQKLKEGSDPDECNTSGLSAIQYFCSNGKSDAVKMLIDAGANVNHVAGIQKSPGEPVSQILANNLFHERSSAHFDSQTCTRQMQKDNMSPLYIAINFSHKSKDIVKDLIKAGADLKLMTNRGFTPLHAAAEHDGFEDIGEILIDAGAEIDKPGGDCGITPLHNAVFYGREAFVDMLIKKGANVNCECNSLLLFLTPLFFAAGLKRPKLVQKLIDAGARDNIRDKYQPSKRKKRFRAIHAAVLSGDTESCEILLKSGVSDVQGDPMLILFLALAKKKGYSGIVEMLRQYSILIPNNTGLWNVFKWSKLAQRFHNFLQRKRNNSQLSESLPSSMHQAGFNSVNATIQRGAAALMEEYARKVQGNERMFLCGSFSEGLGSCLTALDGRVDDDSDIDLTFIDWKEPMCISEFCKRQDCKGIKVKYENGHIDHVMNASSPNAAVLSLLSSTATDFIRAHMCCCYPPIELLKDEYVTKIPSNIIKALKLATEADQSQCHVVSAECHFRTGESMRLSTILLERILMHSLTTIQCQVFILLKYLIKKVINNRVDGVKTYIAKNLLFYMLDKTPQSDWKSQNLIYLVRRSLTMLLGMMQLEKEENVCMRHFFLRDAAVYLKKNHSEKRAILKCIREVICELPQLLTEFQQSIAGNDARYIYLHPFVQYFLWMKFPVSSFRDADQFKEGEVTYDQTYDLVKLIVEKLSLPKPNDVKSDKHLEDMLCCIRKIPNHARTARECLEAMARIKVGTDLQSAVRCISDSSTHSVSKGIPCPYEGEAPSTTKEAKEFVRKHLESHDSAWKFAFIMNFDQKLDFAFLPESLRSFLSPIFKVGYWHMNFNALAQALKTDSSKPVIEDLREEFGEEVFSTVVSIFLARKTDGLISRVLSYLGLNRQFP